MIHKEGLDYLIVDNDLRHRDDLFVDEAFFDAHFPVVAEFPELDETKVYALR